MTRLQDYREEKVFEIHEDDRTCYAFFTHWFLLLEGLHMATAADLKASIDALTAAVAKVSAEVAALKNAPPVVQNVEQADLDTAVAGVDAANAALNAL